MKHAMDSNNHTSEHPLQFHKTILIKKTKIEEQQTVYNAVGFCHIDW